MAARKVIIMGARTLVVLAVAILAAAAGWAQSPPEGFSEPATVPAPATAGDSTAPAGFSEPGQSGTQTPSGEKAPAKSSAGTGTPADDHFTVPRPATPSGEKPAKPCGAKPVEASLTFRTKTGEPVEVRLVKEPERAPRTQIRYRHRICREWVGLTPAQAQAVVLATLDEFGVATNPQLGAVLSALQSRFDALQQSVNGLGGKIDAVGVKADQINGRLGRVEKKLNENEVAAVAIFALLAILVLAGLLLNSGRESR